MSDRWAVLLGWVSLVSGSLIMLFGLWAVLAYIVGVWNVRGEADQSWIFWGLALVVVGVSALSVGVALVLVGRRMVRRGRRS